LIERGLARQIGGKVELEFVATGLRCRISFPEVADTSEHLASKAQVSEKHRDESSTRE
jgi:hypothetical protein